jgi:hypothetical protein
VNHQDISIKRFMNVEERSANIGTLERVFVCCVCLCCVCVCVCFVCVRECYVSVSVSVCVCVSVSVSVSVSERVRERERKKERECVCVFVFARVSYLSHRQKYRVEQYPFQASPVEHACAIAKP